jgi:hypothetical protein
MSGVGFRRTLPNGRSDARIKHSERTKIEPPFVQIRREMLRSPAFRALSYSALRILNRLDIEHMDNAGRENGNLVCTYQDFVDYGVSMGSIKTALSQLTALGFIEIEVTGRRSSGGTKIPSSYRLTYLPKGGVDAKPTDEWARKDEQTVANLLARLGMKKATKGVTDPDDIVPMIVPKKAGGVR